MIQSLSIALSKGIIGEGIIRQRILQGIVTKRVVSKGILCVIPAEGIVDEGIVCSPRRVAAGGGGVEREMREVVLAPVSPGGD